MSNLSVLHTNTALPLQTLSQLHLLLYCISRMPLLSLAVLSLCFHHSLEIYHREEVNRRSSNSDVNLLLKTHILYIK